MTHAPQDDRPLSPHLSIYRYQITSVLSILHRLTGIGLALGLALIVWWFLAAATSPAYFAFVDGLLTTWIGAAVMLGSLWAFWYHFCNGIRHLFWDIGRGFELSTATKTGWLVVVASAALTVGTAMLLANGGPL